MSRAKEGWQTPHSTHETGAKLMGGRELMLNQLVTVVDADPGHLVTGRLAHRLGVAGSGR